jgi:hypothetical protein
MSLKEWFYSVSQMGEGVSFLKPKPAKTDTMMIAAATTTRLTWL